jgi:hypothetical protein
MYPVRNKHGETDYRYSITTEYCGYGTPQFVVRFCDEWLQCFESKIDAINYAIFHNKHRMEKFL